MAITNFFQRSQTFIKDNIKNLADWLNVNEQVMLQYYDRFNAHQRVTEFYYETTGTHTHKSNNIVILGLGRELVLGEELEQAAHQIEHMFPLEGPQQNSAPRLVRLTDNDEEWLDQLRSRSPGKFAAILHHPKGFTSTTDKCDSNSDSDDEEMEDIEEMETEDAAIFCLV